MRYPGEFVRKALTEYAEWPGMRTTLKNAFVKEDEIIIGKLLDSGTFPAANQLSPEEIISNLDKGDIGALRVSAEKSLRRKELYYEWNEMLDKKGEIKEASE